MPTNQLQPKEEPHSSGNRRSGMEGQQQNAYDPPNTKENVPTMGKMIHWSWGSRYHPFQAPQHHNSAVVFPCSSIPFPQQLENQRLCSCWWRLFFLVTPLAKWVPQALVHPVAHVGCSRVTDGLQKSPGFPVSWTTLNVVKVRNWSVLS